jgi:hypothetical protein
MRDQRSGYEKSRDLLPILAGQYATVANEKRI